MREGVPNTHAAPGPDLCCHHPTYLLTSTSSDRGKNAQIQMNIQYIEMYIYAATTLPTYLLPPLLKLFSQRKNSNTDENTKNNFPSWHTFSENDPPMMRVQIQYLFRSLITLSFLKSYWWNPECFTYKNPKWNWSDLLSVQHLINMTFLSL